MSGLMSLRQLNELGRSGYGCPECDFFGLTVYGVSHRGEWLTNNYWLLRAETVANDLGEKEVLAAYPMLSAAVERMIDALLDGIATGESTVLDPLLAALFTDAGFTLGRITGGTEYAVLAEGERVGAVKPATGVVALPVPIPAAVRDAHQRLDGIKLGLTDWQAWTIAAHLSSAAETPAGGS